MNIRFSVFTIDSYEKVLALWKKCDGIGLGASDSREKTGLYLDRNPGMSFIAEKGNEVVGAVLSGHDGRRGYIHHLAVLPEERQKGIGRLLVNRCLEQLGENGIQKCHIFIFNTNEDGKEFWRASGWTLRNDICVVSKFTDKDPQ